MLNIFSHSTRKTTKEWWKYFLTRKLLHVNRGPDAVRESLLRGLNELNIPYRYNPTVIKETTLVLSGVDALKDAIKAKKVGQVNKLIAGPNVVIHPKDNNRIMLEDMVDVILVPSKWVADLWSYEAPEIANKIKVWVAGVEVKKVSSRNGQPIIYDKLGDQMLLDKIQQATRTPARVFTYGSFNQTDYLSALRDAPYLIYLSTSESQGLALQEAWAHNVPTLVNKSTNWKNGQMSWEAEQINCPYLTPELGAIFDSPEQIPSLITSVSKLNPKPYCDQYLSDRVSAQTLMKLL